MSSTTLEWFIAQGKKVNWSNQPFASTLRGMIKTGLHEWGFVVYRCTYGDDEAWRRYIESLEENVNRGLESLGGDVILPQYAKWTVIEDRETLEGATVDSVRKMFVEWRDRHSVELKTHWVNKMIPLLKDPPNRLPRFTYCLYVDQKCLNTLDAFSKSDPGQGRRPRRPPPLVAALIDGDFEESLYVRGGLRAAPDERGQFPAIDGRTCKYVGWEYVDTRGLGDRYDRLHQLRMDDPMDYERPPRFFWNKIVTDDGVTNVED